MPQVFLTSSDTSPWSKPSDWNDAGHTIEMIGAGGYGGLPGSGLGGSGGGGGAYVKLNYSSGTLGSTTEFRVSANSTANSLVAGGANSNATCWLATTNTNAYYARAGNGGNSTLIGRIWPGGNTTSWTDGSPSPIVYTLALSYSGGNSGNTFTNMGGGGGGGAAGPNGNGGNGGLSKASTGSGCGGGGANGGSNGGDATSTTGGSGGNGRAGTGGGAGGSTTTSPTSNGSSGTAGSGGGGGGGYKDATATYQKGGDGATDTSVSWGSYGPGGGGGGGPYNNSTAGRGVGGGNGGLYGGGGGGAGRARNATTTSLSPGGIGASGLIVITYIGRRRFVICT